MMSKRHRWSHFLRVIHQHGSVGKRRKKRRSKQHHKPSFEQLTLLCRSIAFTCLRSSLPPPEFPELLDCTGAVISLVVVGEGQNLRLWYI
jgi:hypothetical protein